MGDVAKDSCQLCSNLLQSERIPISVAEVASAQLTNIWIYLYHENVWEFDTFGGREDGRESSEPKLTFNLCLGETFEDPGAAVVLCEKCCDDIHHLDNLHKEMEAVRRKIESQVKQITNRRRRSGIRQETSAILTLGTPSLVSVGGCVVGKESIAEALEFIESTCTKKRPASPTANANASLDAQTTPNLIGQVIVEREEDVVSQIQVVSTKAIGMSMEEFQVLQSDSTSESESAPPHNQSNIFAAETEDELLESLIGTVSTEQIEVVEMEMDVDSAHLELKDGDPQVGSTACDNVQEDASPPGIANFMNYETYQPRVILEKLQMERLEQPQDSNRGTQDDAGSPVKRRTSTRLNRSSQQLNEVSKVPLKSSSIPSVQRRKMNDPKMKRSSLGDSVKPFSCDQCDLSFKTICGLKLHEKIHTGLRPFRCDECPKYFFYARYLSRHKASVHSEERTQECDKCGKCFKTSDNLRNHRLRHAKKRFECDKCLKRFHTNHELQNHCRLHHSMAKGRSVLNAGKN